MFQVFSSIDLHEFALELEALLEGTLPPRNFLKLFLRFIPMMI
jgi:hypothetical protein